MVSTIPIDTPTAPVRAAPRKIARARPPSRATVASLIAAISPAYAPFFSSKHKPLRDESRASTKSRRVSQFCRDVVHRPRPDADRDDAVRDTASHCLLTPCLLTGRGWTFVPAPVSGFATIFQRHPWKLSKSRNSRNIFGPMSYPFICFWKFCFNGDAPVNYRWNGGKICDWFCNRTWLEFLAFEFNSKFKEKFVKTKFWAHMSYPFVSFWEYCFNGDAFVHWRWNSGIICNSWLYKEFLVF